MHTGVRWGLVAVCLSLGGCGLLSGKKQTAQNNGSRPFTGLPSNSAGGGGNPAPAPPVTPASASGQPDGLLAGQILDNFSRRVSGVYIQVVDLSDTTPSPAKLEVAADNQGYFMIPGLKTGRNYQLIARVKDGDRVLSATTVARPPNPRLSIFVSEDLSSPTTPPVPPPPVLPAKPEADKGKPGGPAASIAPPRPDANGQPPAVITRPQDIAVGPGGFSRGGPVVDVPGPSTPERPPIIVPPPPPGSPIIPDNPTPKIVPGGPTSMAPGQLPVPSCQLVGNKLENLALYDLNRQPWEFRKSRYGRVVLLDFWFSSCGPCLQNVPHLVEMQRRYGPYGLEIVGIAYERGAFADQVRNVRSIRGRYKINYTTLLGGNGGDKCPVKTQFDVQSFPTLVLLDDSGQVLWRTREKEGIDKAQLAELETLVRRQLGLADR